MNPPRLRLSASVLRRMIAVLDDRSDGFVALVRLAGLDPARDFRGAVLDGVDFGTDNLSGFDFSGADLSRADLSRATGLDGIVTDAVTRFREDSANPPADFNLDEVYRMILAGHAPPLAWRPFITELKFTTNRCSEDRRPAPPRLSDLVPLADLRALRKLNIAGTLVSDVSPLANLAALESLNLWNTQVTDVSKLSGLTELRSLDLRGTQLISVSPLANLTRLQNLYLGNTRINDVSPLADLTALRRLGLGGDTG